MPIESAGTFFDALARRGREPRLANVVGSWELDVEGAGTWTVAVDHGALRVAAVPPHTEPSEKPTTRIRLREDALLRLVRGDHHENVFTALLRGAIVIEGDLAFLQSLQAILPLREEWGMT